MKVPPWHKKNEVADQQKQHRQEKNETTDQQKQHRQDMEARRQQQADFEQRLRQLRQRQRALRIKREAARNDIRRFFMKLRLK
jgi:hypothetical protein